MPQLDDLALYSGCRDKLTPEQVIALADVIVANYFCLKATELMTFFWWFKSGKYGKFYGAVDPLAIMAAMKEFMADRNRILERISQREDEERRAEWKKSKITYAEYKKLRGGEKTDVSPKNEEGPTFVNEDILRAVETLKSAK